MQCPYCITAGIGFEPMRRTSEHEYVCLKCGHVSYPRNPWRQCSCERCKIVDEFIAQNQAQTTSFRK
jgi:ribosomal protein L40E